MAQMDSDALRMQLAQLRQEHRDLDAAVEALASTSNQDALQLQRLKCRGRNIYIHTYTPWI